TAGAPVVSVASLAMRPLPAEADAGVARVVRESLFRLDWVQAGAAEPTRAQEPAGGAEGRWAVLGPAGGGSAAACGLGRAAGVARGLVRAAAAENPGRLMLADVDAVDGCRDALAAGIALGEPEFAVRGGELRVPRLGRAGQLVSEPEAGPAGAGRAGTV